jgi:hypothetical protein
MSIEQYVWAENNIGFLGYLITPDGMRMAKDTIDAILDWPIPLSQNEV